MEVYLYKVLNFLKKRQLWLSLIVLLLIIRIIPFLITLFLFKLKGETILTDYLFTSTFIDFFTAGLLVPIIETLIFQVLFFWLLYIKLKARLIYTVIVSSIVFGILHCYSPAYILSAFIAGVAFMVWFVAYTQKYSMKKAFYLIVGVHSINNIISLTIYYFLP